VRLSAHGISAAVPRGWDARIFRRAESEVAAAPGLGAVGVPRSGWTAPVLHLASFPLPDGRGDYGSGAIDHMGGGDVFVALVEFGRESVGTPLFLRAGLPRFRGADLSTASMQRPVTGMGGGQQFRTVSGRAFCCYAVVGSLARRSALAGLVNDALAGVVVEHRA
jgi:hypothetical protein